MKYEPHSYQKYAIEYLKSHPVSALFLDCGLGKTSITLTAINELLFDSFEVRKVLVIAPLRVAKNTWCDEIKKWEHLQNLKYSVAVGTETERLSALKSLQVTQQKTLPQLKKMLGITTFRLKHLEKCAIIDKCFSLLCTQVMVMALKEAMLKRFYHVVNVCLPLWIFAAQCHLKPILKT